MLVIEHSSTYAPERAYVLNVLLNDFLGLEYSTFVTDRSDVRITVAGHETAELIIEDLLFQTPLEDWLTHRAMPRVPLAQLRLSDLGTEHAYVPHTVPVIYGRCDDSGAYIYIEGSRIRLGIDIFGSAFFLLTRYEELVSTERDRHERFPASASLGSREGFLRRPIVNEYLEILWASLSRLFPGLARRSRQPRTNMTFDVDWPIVTMGLPLPQVLHAAGADVLRRRQPILSARRIGSWVQVRRGNLDTDPGNNFDSLMRDCEALGVRAEFNIIAGEGSGDVNGSYTVDHPWIRGLLRRIHHRGHVIGLHPTYSTFRNASAIQSEFDRLRLACEDEGIVQSSWGGRQHYLRWEAPTTWQNYADAGLVYDSTLGYADDVGFRSGTCFEHPVFNLKTRQPIQLRERPLLAMDGAMFNKADKYGMDLSAHASMALLRSLKETCDRYGGDFTILWHNNWLLWTRVHGAYRHTLALLSGQGR